MQEANPRPTHLVHHKKSKIINIYVKDIRKELYESLVTVLEREKKSFSDFVWEQVESYVRLHEPGNPQQTLDMIMKLGKAYHAPNPICGFKDCLRKAVAVGVFAPQGVTYALCENHLREAKENKKQWTILNGSVIAE